MYSGTVLSGLALSGLVSFIEPHYSMAETISNSGGKGGACGGMVKLLIAIDAPDVSIDQIAYILHRICSEIVNCLLQRFLVNCLLFQHCYTRISCSEYWF